MAASGSSDNEIRAFAFAGGALDTIMQLGVAHALLVARGKPPDYIAGVSAGAINAAALAEILHTAPELSDNGVDRLAARADRLREFIQAYQEIPLEVINAVLPNSIQVINDAALKPHESPLKSRPELEDHEKANKSRAGITALLNDLFSIRLKVSDVTWLARRVLGWIAAGEIPGRKRVWVKVQEEARFIAALWARLFPLSTAALDAVYAAVFADKGDDTRAIVTAGEALGRWRFFRVARRMLKAALGIVLGTAIMTLGTLLWANYAVVTLVWNTIVGGDEKGSHTTLSSFFDTFFDRVLAYYGIRDAIANREVLQQQFVRLFDPTYFDPTHYADPVEAFLARALDPSVEQLPPPKDGKRDLGRYSSPNPHDFPIRVIPVAANVATGTLHGFPAATPIVDALCAATAVVPVFPAVKIGRDHFIDGVNVSNEPMSALFEYIRADARKGNAAENPDLLAAKTITVYPVTPLPLTQEQLGGDAEYRGILPVALRAMELQRFRDAKVEYRLTRLISESMPPSGKATQEHGGSTYIRADVKPIELETLPQINQRFLEGAGAKELDTLLYATIAAGCQASLERMIPNALTAAQSPSGVLAKSFCNSAIEQRLGPGAVADLPGCDASAGPGLCEVCASCRLTNPQPAPAAVSFRRSAKIVQANLQRREVSGPDWPIGLDRSSVQEQTLSPADSKPPSPPAAEPTGPAVNPQVALLFGGGVFRGVFQMGVMNALNELKVQPDIVAGSSVGSIIAAMIAAVFARPPAHRALPIAQLAATFILIDKFVITDRFADFIRRFTLRAGYAHVSPHDVDYLFRRFERDSAAALSRRARRTAVGIERLLFITPFELLEMSKLFRQEDYGKLNLELRRDFQDFFDRSGVGAELLGAEPLRTLIEQLVIRVIHDPTEDGLLRDVPVDRFAHPKDIAPPLGPWHSVRFFATTTNLRQGRLEIVADANAKTRARQGNGPASLLFALLGSSAFPAVFRPRRAWEIFRKAATNEQYIDGGVMDNLPLDAVAEFLDLSLVTPGERRPKTPHLLFTASLEHDPVRLRRHGWELFQTVRSWRRLKKRAATLTANRKLDAYARVQRDIRRVFKPGQSTNNPLNLEVIGVKPKWLCGTFAFHPMLGFKRWRQAASIAHGCAATFGTAWAEMRTLPEPRRWGFELKDIDPLAIHCVRIPTPDEPGRKAYRFDLRPRSGDKDKGTCWFRNTAPCPFSDKALPAELTDKERNEVRKIYIACGMPLNHRG